MEKNIHDNEIISYNVNFNKKEIMFETMSSQKKIIIIKFKGVLAHFFETEMPKSILFDIEEFEANKMVEENMELLEKTKAYCWPILYNSINELLEKLKFNKYNYYVISSSFGLSGWVLAKTIATEVKK